MDKIVNFSNGSFSIVCLVVSNTPWFKGREVATILGYANTKQAIINNVDDDDKKRLDELEGLFDRPLDYFRKDAIYINESGLYSLILRSQKEESRIFKKWVTSDVLPSIRKNGMYNMMDTPQQQQIRIYSECDLHRKVVEFMRNHLPGHIVVPGLGELQDTVQKRSQCYYKGYRGGQPDLLILNNHKTYRGFAIELKTPKGNGQMSENQQLYMDMLHQNGFKTLVSNNYDEIVVELTKYFQDVRFKCNHCPKAFKTTATQETHERCMHGKRARLADE
jgi:prophage antirepressor-like protein